MYRFLFLFFLLTACQSSEERAEDILLTRPYLGNSLIPPEEETYYISYGWAYGECRGYCEAEWKFSREYISCTKRPVPRDSVRLPRIGLRKKMAEADWDSLVAVTDMQQFKDTERIEGCPDCNDGGAEWLVVHSNKMSKKIMFEKGHPPPGLEGMLNKAKKLAEACDPESN